MKTIYQHVNVPTEYEFQNMGGKLIVEIGGSRFKCSFHLDAIYMNECSVRTSVFSKDSGWHTILNQRGTENQIVKNYHSRSPAQKGECLRSGELAREILLEMQVLCGMAAEING